LAAGDQAHGLFKASTSRTKAGIARTDRGAFAVSAALWPCNPITMAQASSDEHRLKCRRSPRLPARRAWCHRPRMQPPSIPWTPATTPPDTIATIVGTTSVR
jgi:hypothetical protein